MLKWGIMATGTIAHKFATTLQAMRGEAVLTACGSSNLEHAKTFAEEFAIPEYYGTYEELANAPDVDIIYIATPNSMHFENMKLCINAGKHVLCEKPFTLNVQQAEEIYALAQQRHVFVMEAFWISMLPLHLKIAELIQQGVIGEVKHIRADSGFTVKGARKERKFDKELGGGALLDIGIYNIGFAAMTLGYKPSAMRSSVHLNEYGTDDFETIILEYAQGKTATLTVSIGMRLDKEGVIYGEKGYIYLPDFQKAERMSIRLYDGTEEDVEMPMDINGFEYQIREATRCIEQGAGVSKIQTPQKTLAVLAIMDELRRQWNMQF